MTCAPQWIALWMPPRPYGDGTGSTRAAVSGAVRAWGEDNTPRESRSSPDGYFVLPVSGSQSRLRQMGLEFCEGLFDRIEIWRIGS
jgi:hypothetical protein